MSSSTTPASAARVVAHLLLATLMLSAATPAAVASTHPVAAAGHAQAPARSSPAESAERSAGDRDLVSDLGALLLLAGGLYAFLYARGREVELRRRRVGGGGKRHSMPHADRRPPAPRDVCLKPLVAPPAGGARDARPAGRSGHGEKYRRGARAPATKTGTAPDASVPPG